MAGTGNYSNKERRSFERLKMDLDIIYQVNRPWLVRILVGGREIEAKLLDLSEGGIALNTDYNIPVASNILLKIMIYMVGKENSFKFYKTLTARGEVTSTLSLGGNNHRIGVRFTDMEDEDNKELLYFIKENKKLSGQ